jgi:hypothetical protein
MSKSTPSEFYYHAHGTAISGAITRPVSHVIDTIASTALPISGGAASAAAGNTIHSHPQLGNIVSCKSASAQVAGSLNNTDGRHTTLVTVTVEGLNVLDTVTADRIVMKLSAHHHPSEEEGHFIPLGSHFDNLKIAGHPVKVELDHELFSTCDTYADFKQRYQSDAAFRKRVRKQFLWGDYDADTPQFLKDRFQWHTGKDTPPESKGLVPCTVVKSVQHDQPNVLKTYGNVIIVPQFGKVFLGELNLKSGTRHLTMLRLELGSPVAGSMSIVGGGGNGTTWP